VQRIFLGLPVALVVSILVTLGTSGLICLGLHPLVFEAMDGVSPLLGIFAGAYLTARGNWRVGLGIAALFIASWLVLWLYLQVRWDVARWLEEGAGTLTPAHFAWWLAALAAGGVGGALSRLPRIIFVAVFAVGYALAVFFAVTSPDVAHDMASTPNAMDEEEFGPEEDGTLARLHTFHFGPQADLDTGVYDCNSGNADSDANTSYLGQDLALLLKQLNGKEAPKRQVLCLVNGGFFGGSGWSVAHHEEPILQNHVVRYPVDLLRPADQAWFLILNRPVAMVTDESRFDMSPELPWRSAQMQVPSGPTPFSLITTGPLWLSTGAETVLGGVRPLRLAGHSVELKPGAGVTTLKCSRTSIGWNQERTELYVLTVFDPDGELASQLQRRGGGVQTGGWDVRQVQEFWEKREVPYAVLFDGGESTQAAFRRADGSYFFVPSGYQYSFTLGYFRERPLRFTLPILPPSEAHRGVLNYFYVTGPD
jgi:hypothetical protein